MRQDNIFMVRRLKAFLWLGGSSYVVWDWNLDFLFKEVKVKVPHVSKQHLRWFYFRSRPIKFGRSQEGAGDLSETGLGLLSFLLAPSI